MTGVLAVVLSPINVDVPLSMETFENCCSGGGFLDFIIGFKQAVATIPLVLNLFGAGDGPSFVFINTFSTFMVVTVFLMLELSVDLFAKLVKLFCDDSDWLARKNLDFNNTN